MKILEYSITVAGVYVKSFSGFSFSDKSVEDHFQYDGDLSLERITHSIAEPFVCDAVDEAEDPIINRIEAGCLDLLVFVHRNDAFFDKGQMGDEIVIKHLAARDVLRYGLVLDKPVNHRVFFNEIDPVHDHFLYLLENICVLGE